MKLEEEHVGSGWGIVEGAMGDIYHQNPSKWMCLYIFQGINFKFLIKKYSL